MSKIAQPSDVLSARSELGVATRLNDKPRILEARRALAAAKLAQYIERTLQDAPPLTDSQRAHLASVIGAQR